MRQSGIGLVVIATLALLGCQKTPEPPKDQGKVQELSKKQVSVPVASEKDKKRYEAFKKSLDLRKSYKIYENKELLAKATPENSHVVVDVSEQRAKLLVDDVVAYCTPCTTGSKRKFEPNTKTYRDKRTPYGTFRIMEKIKAKRSNLFGRIYKGKRCIFVGDRRKYKGSKKGIRYEGAPLFYWMRLTGCGIGFHESKYIKRYPGTNGCIRLPKKSAKIFFAKMQKGGKVIVRP